jgi:hypothetical protein
MGFYDSDRFSSFKDSSNLQYVDAMFSSYSSNAGVTWSAWADDTSWRIPLNLTPLTTKRYRVRIRTASFYTAASLHHDVFGLNSTELGTTISSTTLGTIKLFRSSTSSIGTGTLANMTLDCDTNGATNILPVTYTGSPGAGATALLISDEDTTLSNKISSGTKAYKKIQTKSDYVTGGALPTWLWIQLSFVGDFIQPSSFNQELNLVAKVENDRHYLKRLHVNSGGAYLTGTDPLVDGDAYIAHTTTDRASLNTLIDGDFFQTSLNEISTKRQIASSPVITKSLYSGDGRFLVNQPLTYDTNQKISVQLARTTGGTASEALTVASITSYTSGTGAVVLALASVHGLSSGNSFTISGATGGTNYSSINGTWTATAGTSGTALYFTITSPPGTLVIGTGASIAGAVFSIWKDKKYNVQFGSKIVEYSTIGGQGITYIANSASSAAGAIKDSSIIQYNPYDETWQMGLAVNRVAFTDASDSYTSNESTAQATYGGPQLIGNLPFVVTSTDRRGTLLSDPGRIPFFQTDSTKANQTLTDTLFKYQTTNSVLSLSAVNVPNLVVYNNGTNKTTAFITPTSAQLGYSAATPATNQGSFVSFYDYANISSASQYSGAIAKLKTETFTLAVYDATSSYSSTPIGQATSVVNMFEYKFGRTDTNNKLTIGNTSKTSLVIEQQSLTNWLNSTNLYLGNAGTSVTNITGNTTLFADIVSPFTFTEGATKYKLTLRAAATASDNSNSPLIADGGSEYVRLSTDGLMRSPTIDKIWDYGRRIANYGASTSVGTIGIIPETYVSSAVPYNFFILPDLSTITSTPALSTYVPFAAYNSTSAPGVDGFTKSTNPLSLRQLEMSILNERFNTSTLANYIESRKVDKGTKFNDGQGSIISVTSTTGTNSGSVKLNFTAISNPIPPGKLVNVSGLTSTAAVYNGTYVVLTSSTTFITYTNTSTNVVAVSGSGVIDDLDYGSLWQTSKAEAEYNDTISPFTHVNAGSDTATSRTDIFLAADGTWQYLFDYVRIPILATASE